MGWLIRRLLGWVIAGALIGTLGAAVWHGIQIVRAGYALDAIPALTMAFEVMKLHLAAAIGALVGLSLGLLGRLRRRLSLRLRGLFSSGPEVAERVDTDALLQADKHRRADDYLSTLQGRALDFAIVDDAEDPPTVENVITAMDGRFTYRVMAYRHLSIDERAAVVRHALDHGLVREPEPGGTATVTTSVGRD